MAWKNDQVSELETEKILEIAKEQVGVPGDFVELGCYKGDTSLLLAEVLKGSGKELWIYDSFEGLPEKSKEDISVAVFLVLQIPLATRILLRLKRRRGGGA